MLDYIRIGCAVPNVTVGDVRKNAEAVCTYIEKADEKQTDLLIFPELSLTGRSCGDLFWQDTLLRSARDGLKQVLDCSANHPDMAVVVGLPVKYRNKLYNCAAFLKAGRLNGLVPKTYLSREDSRWFASAFGLEEVVPGWDLLELQVAGQYTFGSDCLFQLTDGTVVGIEISDDLFAPVSVSTGLALRGAEVIVNPGALVEMVGNRDFCRSSVRHQSSVCSCVYAYVSAGAAESTSDVVYSGYCAVAENGKLLAENENLTASGYLIVQDCDIGKVRADRSRNILFRDASDRYVNRCYVEFAAGERKQLRSDGSGYPLHKLPFVPSDRKSRLKRCSEIFQLQVSGLKQRLTAIGGANAVIGISGGLDSTLALLVAVEAMRQLGRPASDVYGVTMPCFGTSDRTYRNSWELMRTLGISSKEISIKEAVSQHFRDIGHAPDNHNVTYENSQARERTQILMDYSSVVGGIVVGTGDLSELALGWCTYNGDHMSMYSVNGTVPKTLIRWMIDAISEQEGFAASRAVLQDILDTPISPELLPPDAQGKISQQTEDLVGPYALHDFFLFYVLRYGFAPEKIYAMACRAFEGDFTPDVIRKWLRNFYRRFFTQQFKRNCMPDGVKVGTVGLGPRGDWAMPSDASARLWLDAVDSL